MKNKAKNKPSKARNTKTIQLPHSAKKIADEIELKCLEGINKLLEKCKCELALNAQVTINGQPVKAVIKYIG